MAEADPTQEKLKKYEKAVKKLKAANEKATKELADQKKTFQSALAEKTTLVESLKTAAESSGGGDEGGADSEAQQEILEDREAQIEEEKDKVAKLEEKAVLQEAATKDKLEAQKVKIDEEWKKKFEEAALNADKPKEKKSSGTEVPLDYIPGGVEPWMATFADMVTLLMVFFVLFYSVEKDNTEKFKSALDMMVEEDGPDGLGKIMQVVDSTKILENMKEMKAAAKAAAASEDAVEKKIVLRVPGLNLFEKDGAKLSPEARPVLDEIIKIIKKKGDHKIFIQGHTDDIPRNTPKFESNWELSAVRATAVLRYFYDKGIDPEMLTATGYADTFPYVPNNTKEGRAKNNRVEFVLEKMPEKDAVKAREEKAKRDKAKKEKASKA